MGEGIPATRHRSRFGCGTHGNHLGRRLKREVTHLPYRNWCNFCVMGRGGQEGHSWQPQRGLDEGGPEVSIDYAFPASEGRIGVTILVARKGRSRMTCVTVVPRKGTTAQRGLLDVVGGGWRRCHLEVGRGGRHQGCCQ